MLVAAALVPDTVLLLPGAAGGASDEPGLVVLRDAALAAVAGALATVADGSARVVVVAPGRADRAVVGAVRPGAAAVGVPDAFIGWPVPTLTLEAPRAGPAPAAGALAVPAAVGLQLVLRAGDGTRPVHVVEVGTRDAAALRDAGARLCADGPTVLVVVGSGSARHGPDAPLAEDPAAPAVDAAVADAVAGGGRRARDVLAGLDPVAAEALAVSGWAPWQVLVGALDASGGVARTVACHDDVWRGAAHGAACWRVEPAGATS
ncbi:hypothetical protein [Cellulomonas shaoxiangyii]|uniref:Uncharacterized protein n=1 Tax=Cellulomonas shaoxiangyii TaxID=2566013 RepID=A0A4P7SM55_9CELL|nr:hypothetical protein [Cellulomonas shaoxiangyii]QCB93924.1 hypothetical protein E5225_10480 [Cellulomonas shaoxiangyii]TGY85997.1 hypothetical protein E5226_04030 [Cellulomonas shaoxiangyii]